MSSATTEPKNPVKKNPNQDLYLPSVDGPAVIYAVRWLIVDTFRQALASWIFWIMLAVSGICIVFCLGTSITSGLLEPLPGDMEMYVPGKDGKPVPFSENARPEGKICFLGLIEVQNNRHVDNAVGFIQIVLASFVVGTIGFLLALIWTSGFLPDFLQPSAASVLLAKPIPRWTLIIGKYLGVVTFVGFQILVFFVGTWLALGIRHGVWEYGYLAAIPLFVLNFSVIYSFSVLLAVCTRSTIACLFGSILFWLVCWGMNIGHHFIFGFEEISGGTASLGPMSQFLTEMGYWILPKPADISILLEQAMGAQNYTVTLSSQSEFQQLVENGAFFPIWSILASLVFSVTMLFVSGNQLAATDY